MKIVITGGPCGGKSTVIETLENKGIDVIPEAATEVLKMFPPYDGTREWREKLQKEIFSLQIRMEEKISGLTLLDRGLIDCAAYLPGGIEEFENYGIDYRDALARYDKVIHLSSLAMDDPEQYRQYCGSNPHRRGTAEEAAEMDRKVQHVWKYHPQFRTVSGPLQYKLETVLSLIA